MNSIVLIGLFFQDPSPEQVFGKMQKAIQESMTLRVKYGSDFTLQGKDVRGGMIANGELLLGRGSTAAKDVSVSVFQQPSMNQFKIICDGKRMWGKKDDEKPEIMEAPKWLR